MLIRLEQEQDFREVETLTREAFWNKYRPGCDEHFVLHLFRSRPDFVKELDYVIEEDGRLAAHIMYFASNIALDDGKQLPVLGFGPVSVLPELQGRGYGSAIIKYTLEKARSAGYGGVVITGSPQYYNRFGFVDGGAFGIRYSGAPEGEDFPYFMAKELKDGYFAGVSGVFSDPDGYTTDPEALAIYDAAFPKKQKLKLPGQLFE